MNKIRGIPLLIYRMDNERISRKQVRESKFILRMRIFSRNQLGGFLPGFNVEIVEPFPHGLDLYVTGAILNPPAFEIGVSVRRWHSEDAS